MNHIKRRKNGGDLILEPLKNGLNDLRDGEEYVYLGKHNRVLEWRSPQASILRIGRVIWDYNVKFRGWVICEHHYDRPRWIGKEKT